MLVTSAAAYRHSGVTGLAVNARIATADPGEAQTIERAYQKAGITGVLRVEAESYQREGALFDAARCYVQIGENNLAFSLLRNYYKRHHPSLSRLNVDPDFDPVRSDLRFRELLRAMGFTN